MSNLYSTTPETFFSKKDFLKKIEFHIHVWTVNEFFSDFGWIIFGTVVKTALYATIRSFEEKHFSEFFFQFSSCFRNLIGRFDDFWQTIFIVSKLHSSCPDKLFRNFEVFSKRERRSVGNDITIGKHRFHLSGRFSSHFIKKAEELWWSFWPCR